MPIKKRFLGYVMKINRIIAPGETIIYQPRLTRWAYLHLGSLIRNLTTTIFVSDKRFFHSYRWRASSSSKGSGAACSITAPLRYRERVPAPSCCTTSSAPWNSSAKYAPSRAAAPAFHRNNSGIQNILS